MKIPAEDRKIFPFLLRERIKKTAKAAKGERHTMITTLTARHTGNAGILINIEKTDTEKNAAGEKPERVSLGIDVFCRDRKRLYEDTPEKERAFLLDRIESGELKALVFTHEHGDHFCLEDVLEAWRRNPRLPIISTRKVIQKIRQSSPKGTVVSEGALTEISPGEKGFVKLEAAPGMQLTLFNSPHMGDQFSDIQNLVCLLEAGGRRLLIPGDARPDAAFFERAAAWSPVIDWLIGPFPLLGLPSSRKKIAAALTVRHVLAVHLPRPEMDAHGWRESAVKVCERAADGLPMPLFGDVIGENYRL